MQNVISLNLDDIMNTERDQSVDTIDEDIHSDSSLNPSVVDTMDYQQDNSIIITSV